MHDTAALQRFMGVSEGHNYEVTPERVSCLTELLGEPTRYIQRFVEQASFVSTGGQCWHRTLQIQIPETDSPGAAWWIVPLGQFYRGRLADLTVEDSAGTRLNILTRRQHGDALTDVTTTKYVLDLIDDGTLEDDFLRKLTNTLRGHLFNFFTASRVTLGRPAADSWLLSLETQYKDLLDAAGLEEQDQKAQDFRTGFTPWIEATQYLCWVQASPGDVLNLRSTYTARDSNHQLKAGTFGETLHSLWTGLKLPWAGDEQRRHRASWYRQYGLAPIQYEIKMPREPGPASYYFTLEPPSYTKVTYLDWENDNSFNENPEVDCAFGAAHIHETSKEPLIGGGDSNSVSTKSDKKPGQNEQSIEVNGTIRAYLRCTPHRHKQVLGAAALNIAVVWLLAKGNLPIGFGEPLQVLIAAAPSVVIAFLAQQQRHYYSHVMRRQRALLWFYLVISVFFLLSVAFDARDAHGESAELSMVATVAAWVLAIASGGVFGWHLLLGGSYERAVRYLTRRESRRHKDKPMWVCFGDSVRQYCVCIVALTVICAVITLGGLIFFWNPSSQVICPDISQVSQDRCSPNTLLIQKYDYQEIRGLVTCGSGGCQSLDHEG